MTTKNKDEESTVYDEGDSSVVVEEHSTTSRAKKPAKKGGLLKVIGFVAVLGIVGATGWYVFGGGNAPTPAKVATKAPKKEVPKVEEKPVEAAPAPAEVAPIAPETAAGTIPNTAIDPLTGAPLPVDNTIPTEVGIDPLAPTSTDPLAGTIAPTVPAEINPVVAPTTPVVEPAVIAPVAPTTSNGDLVAQISGAVTDALNPIIRRLDSVESRLGNLESRRSTASVSSDDRTSRNALTPTPPRRSAAAPAKKKRPAAPAPVRNSIEVLTPVASTVTTVTTVEAKPVVSCQISAVVHGSAWLKNSDGSFKGYSVGEALPDGQRITAITPDKGIQVGSKTWTCK